MSETIKKNVATFDQDVGQNDGYRYTTNASYSSKVSNLRLSNETELVIRRWGPAIRSVIDIGCGDGTYTNELASRLPEVSFTGFDPASKAIEIATRRFPQCSFAVGNVLDAGTFPEKLFDLAILRGVIHHLPTQKSAIENAMKLSNRILIIEPNGNNPILKMIEKTSKYHVEHEEQSFSSTFFIRIANELGLKVRRLSFVGFVPFFFPTLPAKVIYFFQPLLERIPLLGKYFAGQIILLLENPDTGTGT